MVWGGAGCCRVRLGKEREAVGWIWGALEAARASVQVIQKKIEKALGASTWPIKEKGFWATTLRLGGALGF